MTPIKIKPDSLPFRTLCVLSALSVLGAPIAAHAGPASENTGGKGAPGQIRPARDGVIYSIARDETLSVVAARFTGDSRNWHAIGKLNRIDNDRTVPIGTNITIPARLLPEKMAFATIAAVHGDVSILGKDGAIIPAEIGTALPEGAMIATSAQGFITLTLKDGTYFSVTPASNLQLSLLRIKAFTERPRTSLTLEKGRVSSTVTPFTKPETRYEVHTPLTAAGVRGTSFRVNFDGGKSFNEVLEGTVRVAPPGLNVTEQRAKDVKANYGAVIAAAGQTVKPVVLPDPPVLDDGDAVQDKLPLRFTLHPAQAAGQTATQQDVRGFRASVSRDAKGEDTVAEASAVNAATTSAAGTANAGADGATNMSVNTVLRIPDLADGHYYVHVSSLDSNGLEGRPATREFTLKAHPLPPFPIEPGPKLRSSVDGQPVQVLFKWADVGDGNLYHLQIAADAGFTQLLLDRSDLKTPEFTHDAVPAGSFYWRVATVASTNGQPDQGPYSDVKPLDILPVQQAPQPTQDEDMLHFSWRGEPGQTFVFEIAATSDFAAVLKHIDSSEAQVAFTRPAAGTYYARVRSIDADGYQGAFSQAQKFEVFGVWKNSYGGTWNTVDGPLRNQF